MSRKRSGEQEPVREEFASELTPDVNGGECSRRHRRFTGESRERREEHNSAPDDVEWGPSVRGHDFRVN